VVMRVMIGLIALAAMILAGSGAWAAGDPKIFEVRDVPVDATAAAAQAARDQAFAQGQGQAFDILLRRLTLKSDWSRLPSAAGQDFKRLISGFAVGGEKRSSTRYIAKVTYVFVPERIRVILRGAGIPFSETRAKPVIVLPVLQTVEGKRLLWEPENLWAQVWREKPSAQGLVPMIVPPADPASPVQVDQLAAPSWAQLEPLATPRGASSVLIAEMTLRRAGDQLQADVSLTEIGPGKSSPSHITASGPDEKAAMGAAVDAITDPANEAWKQTTAVSEGTPQILIADVSYTTLDGWLRIRRAIQNVPTVRSLRIIALASDGAEVEISYVGTSEQLGLGLAQQDVALGMGQEGHYLLSSTAPPPTSAPAPVEAGTPAPASAVPGPQ